MRISDDDQLYADRDWWQAAGDVLDLQLHGWSDRLHASFIDRQTGAYVPLTEAMAKRLHDIAAAKVRASREGDGEWRTMDSAPLNGRHCILAVKEGPFVYSVQGAYDGKKWNCVHRENVSPLYWMPNKLLPEGWETLAATPIPDAGDKG